MSDENDDLDAFARLFGAEPETPPEGLLPPTEARPTAPAAPPAAVSPGDPLGWLLSDQPPAAGGSAAPTAVFPNVDPFAPAPVFPADPFAPGPVFPADPAAAFPTATATAAPTQVLPTRRSVAAEAAAGARDTGRRNLIILGSIGALVLILIVVLILVLIGKSGTNSPSAASTTSASPSTSGTATPSATPSATPTPTPTPTPTATQTQTVAPPPPSPPTVTGFVSSQPDCSGSAPYTVSIGYTSANGATLSLMSSDGTVNMNLTPAASGTIPNVPYQCGTGETYTLTVFSSSEGVTPATATVTPVPN